VIAIRVQWSAVERHFRQTKRDLEICNRHFEAEAALASVQSDVSRHEEVMSQLSDLTLRTTASNEDVLTTGLVARNATFSGRDEILDRLYHALEVSHSEKASKKTSCKSCTIHGVGGLGKSQVALEYTYRYRDLYKYIFWIRAETDAVLADSFLSILQKVGIDGGPAVLERKIGMVREWLEQAGELPGRKAREFFSDENEQQILG